MSSLRITQNSMFRTQLAGLNTSLGRLQQTQEQLTSGKRLNRPSDNPVDTVSAMRLRGEQQQLQQLGENITDGVSRLRAADDALTSSLRVIERIRTQALAAANGVNSTQQRSAYAQEIAGLREGVLQMANSQYAGQPLFAGTQNVTAAFDPVTGAYQGNDLPVLRQVTDAPGAAGQMNVAVDGELAFGGALEQETGSIAKLVEAIRSGDEAGIQEGIAAMDALQDQVLNAASVVGTRSARLERLEQMNGRQDDASKIALSKVEDVDFMKAAMDLSIQSNAYQAALSASAKVIQPTLIDFLR